jgi:DNA gyrase/topoisomerase IV subunit A
MIRGLLLASSLGVVTVAAAHPLEDAAHEAMALCTRLDGVETIDQCMRTTSPSPDRQAAKAALQQLFKERNAFMRQCDAGRNFGWCQEQADLYTLAGIYRDFKWTVQHLDRVPPHQRR